MSRTKPEKRSSSTEGAREARASELGFPHAHGVSGIVQRRVDVAAEVLLAALAVLALPGFAPAAAGPLWRTSLILALALIGVLVFGRLRSSAPSGDELVRPQTVLLGIAIGFLVEHSGALDWTWALPGMDGLRVSLVVPIVLGVGALWALSDTNDPGERHWNQALCVTSLGLLLWLGATTLLLAPRGLVSPSGNAGTGGRWLLLVALFAGASSAAARSRARADRLSLYASVVLLVGLVRGFVH